MFLLVLILTVLFLHVLCYLCQCAGHYILKTVAETMRSLGRYLLSPEMTFICLYQALCSYVSRSLPLHFRNWDIFDSVEALKVNRRLFEDWFTVVHLTLGSPYPQDSHPNCTGFISTPHPEQALDFNICLLGSMSLSKACTSRQGSYSVCDQKAAGSIAMALLPQLGSHRDKDEKLLSSGGHRNQKPWQLLLSPDPHCACGEPHKWTPCVLCPALNTSKPVTRAQDLCRCCYKKTTCLHNQACQQEQQKPGLCSNSATFDWQNLNHNQESGWEGAWEIQFLVFTSP